MFKNLRKKKKGFTLIELIIVIAIIAILAAVAVPKFGAISKDAKEKADIANAKTIANAVSALIADGSIGETVDSIEVEKGATEGTDAEDIENYLQNIPKTKSDGNFFVKVTDGTVTVYRDEIIAGNEVFPTN